MNAQMTEDEKTEKIGEYGMMVSALHDSRYFDTMNAYEGEATPYNCPKDIKKILVERYGDKWKDDFWGADYDDLFPTIKVLHKQMTGIKPTEEVCAVLPTAAEARQKVIENLSGESLKQFNELASKINEAIAEKQIQLTTDIRFECLEPTVRAKLESLGYRIDYVFKSLMVRIYW
jgi:hypothetical protein